MNAKGVNRGSCIKHGVGTWSLIVKPVLAEIERDISGHSSPLSCAAKYFSHCFEQG